MKTTKIILITTAVIIFAACRATKNSITATNTSVPSNTVNTTEMANNFPLPKPISTNGIYPPGNEELMAIQRKYTDVTIDMLRQGHEIYIVGKCINCHSPKNIYTLDETQWKDIMDDMAAKANLTAIEKDAVYKYVLAIKATQPK